LLPPTRESPPIVAAITFTVGLVINGVIAAMVPSEALIERTCSELTAPRPRMATTNRPAPRTLATQPRSTAVLTPKR
jgi:hypothetical protein